MSRFVFAIVTPLGRHAFLVVYGNVFLNGFSGVGYFVHGVVDIDRDRMRSLDVIAHIKKEADDEQPNGESPNKEADDGDNDRHGYDLHALRLRLASW